MRSHLGSIASIASGSAGFVRLVFSSIEEMKRREL
jgi:hypothetical protein